MRRPTGGLVSHMGHLPSHFSLQQWVGNGALHHCAPQLTFTVFQTMSSWLMSYIPSPSYYSFKWLKNNQELELGV